MALPPVPGDRSVAFSPLRSPIKPARRHPVSVATALNRRVGDVRRTAKSRDNCGVSASDPRQKKPAAATQTEMKIVGRSNARPAGGAVAQRPDPCHGDLEVPSPSPGKTGWRPAVDGNCDGAWSRREPVAGGLGNGARGHRSSAGVAADYGTEGRRRACGHGVKLAVFHRSPAHDDRVRTTAGVRQMLTHIHGKLARGPDLGAGFSSVQHRAEVGPPAVETDRRAFPDDAALAEARRYRCTASQRYHSRQSFSSGESFRRLTRDLRESLAAAPPAVGQGLRWSQPAARLVPHDGVPVRLGAAEVPHHLGVPAIGAYVIGVDLPPAACRPADG